MRNLLKKTFALPGTARLDNALKNFTVGEAALFYLFVAAMTLSTLLIFAEANDTLSVTVPSSGGKIVEGTVGSPRFINPLLAISDADRDITALTFSGLLRATPFGELTTDLAEKYEISPDGLTYTVTLKEDAVFHDGKPISADDVIFTVGKAKDPSIKSPKRAEWEGVTAEKISDKVVAFHLPRQYFPFVENLTLGIIPKHFWTEVGTDEFSFSLKNINPVGSGPYKIFKIESNEGIPTSYELHSFSKYVGGKPFISTIIMNVYGSESELIAAWKAKAIESMGGISPQETEEMKMLGARVETLNLPRVYGIFFNQNQAAIFIDKNVRDALDKSIDKEALIEDVLKGYGTVLTGPLPEDIKGQKILTQTSGTSTPNTTGTTTDKMGESRKLLEKSGWKLNEETKIYEKTDKKTKTTQILSFSLFAPNVPELKDAANFVIQSWKELGASVELKLFELSDLSQNIIRPRKYDAILFGEVIGRNPDLFAFWHSSQRNDPGYNIAMYTNSKVDQMLNEARIAKNQQEQEEILRNIDSEIKKDTPAIFLYTPEYLYVLPPSIKGFSGGSIASPGERFAEIKDWFIENEKVW